MCGKTNQDCFGVYILIRSSLNKVFFTRSLSFHGQSEDLKSRKCEFVFVCSIQKIDASVFLVKLVDLRD